MNQPGIRIGDDNPATLPGHPFPSELVLENAIVGVSYMIERRFIWANVRMTSIFGYQDGELNGQSVRMLYLNEEDYQAVGSMYSNFAQNNAYTHERAMVLQGDRPVEAVRRQALAARVAELVRARATT